MSGACDYIPNSEKHYNSLEEGKENKLLEILRLAAVAVIMVFVAWIHLLQPDWIANIVTVTAVIIGGYPLYRESFSALRKGRVNMELSMAIAIVASLILLQFLPAIAITFFALLSEFIESFIVEKGRKNIQILYNRTPKKAIVMKSNYEYEREEQEIPVSEVKVGDVVVVREGDIISVDGCIINGISTVDQSSITGESIPVEKIVGDVVFAGTINLTHQLEVKCDKLSTDSTFAKIIHLVEEAEASKAPIQKLSDKIATRLIQFAIGLSVLTFIVTQNIVSTLSVIVVAGACGLAVGTPTALLAANSKLAKRGIIVKGGLQIENLKHAGTIVFDKTGTLTSGKPVVSQVISFESDVDPRNVLEYAAIAEKNVNHPLAKAIKEKAIKEKIEINTSSNKYQSENNDDNDFVKVGRGVTRSYNGRRMSVGNLKFMEEELAETYGEENYSVRSNSKLSLFLNKKGHDHYRYLVNDLKPNAADITLKIAESDNNNYNHNNSYNNNNDTLLFSSTTAFVSIDRQIIGAVLLEDKLREGARDAISKIKAMGIHIIMLTGDNDKIARKISNEAIIDEYYANLLPQEKVSKIEQIVKKQKKANKTVIMVGDGINDAPALAKAHVGIAMGRTGTDIAIETADVVLMLEDLSKIPYLLKVSRQSLSAIQQNFFGTLFIDGLGFVLAFIGVINPLLAALIHVGSELVFMVNSARLLIDNGTKDPNALEVLQRGKDK